MKEGDMVKTKSENLVDEFKALEGLIVKISNYGEIWIRLTKGNRHHHKNSKLMFPKQHLQLIVKI